MAKADPKKRTDLDHAYRVQVIATVTCVLGWAITLGLTYFGWMPGTVVL